MSIPSAMEKPSILIVDDTSENIDVLRGALRDRYSVHPALNGATALKIAAAIPQPDLILLDIMMPHMDGYEVMRNLQASPATRDIPVIFITALADIKNEIKGIEAGAVDYITKPFNTLVVRTRIAAHLALRQTRRTLEIRNQELLEERTLIEDIILRMRSHKSFDDRHLRYLSAPLERTTGDILLSAFTSDGRQRVLVGDFAGHGLSAAVAAPLVAHVFYDAASAGRDLISALASINHILFRQLPANIFMAGCAIEISAKRDKLMLWNAGMPECLIYTPLGTRRAKIPSTGIPPFGVIAELDLFGGHSQFDIEAGERFYIFSDGVTETANSTGELFGVNGVEQFITTMKKVAPLEELLVELESYRGDCNFQDDITFVEINI